MTIGSPPFMPEEIEELSSELRDIVDVMYNAWSGRRGDTGRPCYFHNTRTHECRIYDERPAVCREFEPGCAACEDFREQMERKDGE